MVAADVPRASALRSHRRDLCALFTIIAFRIRGAWPVRAMAAARTAGTMGTMNTRIALLTVAASLVAATAHAGALPKGAVVRIEGTGIESGWHAGTVARNAEGCTVVKLDKATKGGYTMVSLMGAARLERLQSGAWVEMPLKALRAPEPKPCLVDGSD
jgi:hypothetical protein